MRHDSGREIIGKFLSLSFNLINIDFVFLFFLFFELVTEYQGREKKKLCNCWSVANEHTYVSYFQFSRNIRTAFNSRDVNCEQGWSEKKFTRE